MFETYYTGGRGVEIMTPTHGLLDMTVYGHQETSAEGWTHYLVLFAGDTTDPTTLTAWKAAADAAVLDAARPT